MGEVLDIQERINNAQWKDFWSNTRSNRLEEVEVETGAEPKYFEEVDEPLPSIGKTGTLIPSTLLLLGLTVVVLVLLLQKYGSQKRSKGKDPKNDGTRGSRERITVAKSIVPIFSIPIIDGFYNVYRADKYGVKFFEMLTNEYGNCFEIPIGFGPAYCISDPYIIQKLLTSNNPKHLNKAKEYRELFVKGFMEDVLFIADTDIWAPHKKILSRSYTHKSLQSYLKIMNGNGKEMSRRMLQAVSNNETGSVEGSDVLGHLDFTTIKIITEIILGPDAMTSSELETFLREYSIGKQNFLDRSRQPYLLVDAIWQLHPKKRELDKTLDFMRAFISNIINNYREKRKIEMEPGLETKEGLEDGGDIGIKPFVSIVEGMLQGGMSDEEIRNEVGGTMLAGHDATTIVLITLLFHLALHPEYQQMCREEVDNLMESKMLWDGDDFDCELTMEDIGNLKYLERCIIENLRLTPAFPVYVRRLDAPLKIDDDLELEGDGRNVFILAWNLHRNPEYYPNPLTFDPDRFLPENVKQRPFYSYIPFSAGPKICLGMKMAMNEIKVLMFWILRNFEISTTDRMEDVTYSIEVTLQTNKPINLILKRREANHSS